MNTSKHVVQQPVEPGEVSYTERFAHGTFWSLMGTVGSRIFSFATIVVVARFLGKVGFGELAMIQSTIGMMGTFAGLGIGMTATKFVAELRFKDPERTGHIISLTYLVSWTAGGVMALFCLLAAPWLATNIVNAPHLAPELRLASLLLLISAGFGPQQGVLAGLQAFRAMARINWCQGLASLPVTVLLVWLAGLRGVILALIITTFIGALISAFFLKRKYKDLKIELTLREAWREKSILWQFSLPAFLSSLILTTTLWITRVLLVNQPNGYVELGLFNAALQFQWMITAVNTIVAPAAVPILAEIHGQDDPERFDRVFNLNLRLNWSLGLVFGFVVLSLSPWLMHIFGEKYHAAAPLLPLVICFTVIGLVNSIGGQFFYSTGFMWDGFKITFISCFLLLTASYFLIPFLQSKGLALAYVFSSSLALIYRLSIISKKFRRSIVEGIHLCILSSLFLLLAGFILFYWQLSFNTLIIMFLIVSVFIFLIIKQNYNYFLKIYYQISLSIPHKIGMPHAAKKY
jgi:O-antigen/teichoic acid export membrane protein